MHLFVRLHYTPHECKFVWWTSLSACQIGNIRPSGSKMSSGHSLGVGRYYNSHAVMVVNGSNVTCRDSF